MTSVTIPNSVTSIGSSAFAWCSSLTSVTIPNSVTSIGEWAFYDCSSLTSVTIGNSVTSIGEKAFYECSSLTSIEIPNSVTSIGNSAFETVPSIIYNGTATGRPWGARSLNGYIEGNLVYADATKTTLLACFAAVEGEIVIPNSVTSIGDYAFYNCRSLTSVTIPNSVTSIGDYAFYNCSGLTSVTIPNSVTSIGERAFEDCRSLTSVTIPNSVTSIGNYAFYYCSSLTSVEIPNSVTSIGSSAFSGCSGLTSVEIPNSVTSIGSYAFNNVPNIVYTGTATGSPWGAKCLNGYVEGYLVFSDESKANIVSCSASAIEIVIPNSVTNIGKKAFQYCSSLTSIEIPNSVTSIGERAFSGCSGLTSVEIPNSVTSIGSSAFSDCNSLPVIDNIRYADTYLVEAVDKTFSAYTIKDGTKWIGSNAFSYCSSLISVTIPNSVTSIGNGAFWDCSGLTSVTIPNSVTSIGEEAFRSCSSLTSLTIPDNVSTIGNNAFRAIYNIIYNGNAQGAPWGAINMNLYEDGWLIYEDDTKTNLKRCLTSATGDVIIPNSVTSIEEYAFRECYDISTVIIPNSVTTIGSNAFVGVLNVTYSGSVQGAPWGAKCLNGIVDGDFVYSDDTKSQLIGCSAKATGDIIIPEAVTQIGGYTFAQCTNIESIAIGSDVTSIGIYCFSGCNNLKAVYITDLATWCQIEFAGVLANPLYYAGSLYVNGEKISSLIIPNNIDKILDYAFAGGNMQSVTIPNDVTSIGEYAFYGCRSLTSITIPNSVTSIGEYAFYGCRSLTSVTIPNSVTSIGSSAFSGCSSLTSVTIPNSVTSIGSGAFSGCSSLSIICSVPATRPTISSNTFRGIASDVVVYVSNEAVSNYKNSSSTNYWKDLNIVGIDFFGAEKSETPTSVTLTTTALLWEIAGLYVASVGIEGGEQEVGSTLEYIGLEPNSEYKDVPVVLTSNTGETETVNVTFTTIALTLTTQQPKVVSSTTAILLAETNMSDAEVNCGFEWKRENAPDAMAGTKVYCPVANGTMAGRLKGLKDDVYYKYRAFYQSTAGNTYYGDWQYIFTGDDAVEFDPVMYTYAASAVTETEATLKGYALAGSDEFTEQGFEYWAESRVIPEGANHAPVRAYQNAIGEHQSVQATGISMKVTLTNLDEGTVYKYRTYAVVNGAKVYGSEMSFTTRGEYLYTVTFVDYDGTILGSDRVHYGTAATAPEDPSRGGYNFSGWDKDYSNVTDDLTVTAQYTVSTALPEATTDSSVQKFIRDGQLFIQKSGKTYTLQGVEVR